MDLLLTTPKMQAGGALPSSACTPTLTLPLTDCPQGSRSNSGPPLQGTPRPTPGPSSPARRIFLLPPVRAAPPPRWAADVCCWGDPRAGKEERPFSCGEARLPECWQWARRLTWAPGRGQDPCMAGRGSSDEAASGLQVDRLAPCCRPSAQPLQP